MGIQIPPSARQENSQLTILMPEKAGCCAAKLTEVKHNQALKRGLMKLGRFNKCRSITFSCQDWNNPSELYNRLSALKRAGIIELAFYREVKGDVPEEVQKSRTTKVIINLLIESEVK